MAFRCVIGSDYVLACHLMANFIFERSVKVMPVVLWMV